MTKRILVGLGLCMLSSTFACASDPNKEANDAHDAELKAERKDQQAAADDRSDQRVKTAEQQRDMTAASATGPSATKERVAADAKVKEAQDVARAKAMERLEKADARTNELRGIVKRAGGKATTASQDALSAVDTQRAAAKTSIDQLAASTEDNWKQAKSTVDTQLDTLEGYVKRAGAEVDKFK